MKKQDLVDVIASNTGENKKVVEKIVNNIFDTIVESLKKEEVVDIYGFGKFKTVYKEAHKAKNPKTGEIFDVPGKYKAKMTYSSAVQNAINN